VLHALETMQHEIEVEEPVRRKAAQAVNRMLELA